MKAKWQLLERAVRHDQPMDHLEELLTPQDLAAYLKVPVATLYAWRHRGEGPDGFRVGRHLRYRWSDVEKWLRGQIKER